MHRLQKAAAEKLEKFNKLRGHEVRTGEFWDIVVVTAIDEDQKLAYELQLSEKLRRRELPLGIHYHVFADPPGYKIGNGGSTLYVLENLEDKYGESLSKFKIMIIHAGGLSQRLPNASALGKIFTALPLGDPVYQMLELKLSMYIDFPIDMKPGVLVTCADDIELYNIASTEKIVFDKPGFTALAHPSPLSIGTTHGVFVLDPREESGTSQMEYRSCYRFLHKPSIEKMYENGAVCKGTAMNVTNSDFVYTDSTYYIDYATVQCLLLLLKDIRPIICEIDAYGDFLQALGPGATIAYTQNSSNVTTEESSLLKVRQIIFQWLQGKALNVIVLNNSKFYHIGTTGEYLFHLTQDDNFRSELNLVSSAFSTCPSVVPGSCIIHSVLHPSCSVGPGTVIEYSRLGANVTIGEGAIISGCDVSSDLHVPSGVFMHSLSVKVRGTTSYVTVAFAIEDNMKQCVTSLTEIDKLQLFGNSLEKCLHHWSLRVEDLKFSGDMGKFGLWNASIFPQCSDLRRSFTLSSQMICSLYGKSTFRFPKDIRLLSIQEVLQYKNLEEMLKFRQHLYEEIQENKNVHLNI
ncbi:fucose-1-phosphate guanylyltransferase isoform X1 [Paramormyrops kingsleyae]|uniref:Fucose-1-phosphate guanylyltransferase n=1 Tax=Paramormyrops kingsleyae TaxID=1676925 RepID=A0A3B3T346_9TELE|nr:fucose-1-phosphate guanylyltransferase isoform X1 [Paramormyrops kingsleyae]